MYEKLARGHATAYINGLQEYARLLDWIDGPWSRKAMDAFERSSFSKKPGRVLNRLTPLVRPQYRQMKIEMWARQYRAVSARGLASAAENQLFRLPDDTRPLYSERAVFLVGFLLSRHYDEIKFDVMTGSSISHHAIARLLEHGVVSPTTLSADIMFILEYCDDFFYRTLDTATDRSAMISFMLPFKRGALVAVFMNTDPVQVHKGQRSRRVLSVRTYLDAGKLSDQDMERMGGLVELVGIPKRDDDVGNERFSRWIKGNVRPWQFSDSIPGDQG